MRNQNAHWSEVLPVSSSSGTSTAMASFRSILTDEEFSFEQSKTSPSVNGPDETEAHTTKAAARAHPKSHSGVTGIAGSRTPEDAGIARPGGLAKTNQARSPLQLRTAPSVLAQPVPPNKTKIQDPAQRDEAPFVRSPISRSERNKTFQKESFPQVMLMPSDSAQSVSPLKATIQDPTPPAQVAFARSPISRSERKAEGNSESEIRTIDSRGAEGPGTTVPRVDKDILKSENAKTHDNGRSSFTLPNSERINEGKVSSSISSTSDPKEDRRESLAFASVESVGKRKPGPPDVSPKQTVGQLQRNNWNSSADTALSRVPRPELISLSTTPAKTGTAEKEQSFRPMDRLADNPLIRRPNPAGPSLSQRILNSRQAEPQTASSSPSQRTQTSLAGISVSKTASASLPATIQRPSLADQANGAHRASDQQLHLNSNLESFVEQQPTSASVTRAVIGMQGINHSNSNAASDASFSNPVSASSNSQQTFAALDEESRASSPVWIHAGGNKAEAGFKDPTLGWVGVRAQADASGVHAALVPSSPDASRTLSGDLPSLSAYLGEHHTAVQTLTMASPESSWAGEGSGHPGGMEGEQGKGHGRSGHQAGATNHEATSDAVAQPNFGLALDSSASLPLQDATGARYISVVA
jgi:hypothetical protein